MTSTGMMIDTAENDTTRRRCSSLRSSPSPDMQTYPVHLTMMRASNTRMTLIHKNMTVRNSNNNRRRMLWMTAAAALSTLPSSQAFTTVVGPMRSSSSFLVTPGVGLTPLVQQQHQRQIVLHKQATRLYSNRNDDSGILSKVGSVVKKVLPGNWFRSEKEKKAALERKQIKAQVKGGLNQILKDAPLPIRMIGQLVAPIMSQVMSGLAETMAEQQKAMESIKTDAQAYLAGDAAVSQLLGEPIQLGDVFSQSSSSSSINGQMSTRIELAFPVTGRNGSGVAQVSATEKGIQDLRLQVDGRTISVNLSGSPKKSKFFGGGSSSSSSKGGADDVIEAEIIEKETKN